jgi:cell division septum initiation protein DivIVA
MTNTNENIFFPEVRNGYDRGQVDKYINKLSEAYQAAYDENTAIWDRYNTLLAEYNKLNIHEQIELNSDVVTKTLIYAEMLAQKIITDAHEEAERARGEMQKIIADANTEAVVRARKNLEQAHEIMQEAISKVESLLTFNEPFIKNTIGHF